MTPRPDAAVRAALARFAGAALDLLLPPRCGCCSAEGVDRHGLLCPDCFRAVSFIVPPCCERCGLPFPAAPPTAAVLCDACRSAPPRFRHARAALRYDAASRRLILPLKHADRDDLAKVLAPHMARAGAALLAEAELIVPVPLHRARLRRRRYNQAALLARALGRVSGLPVALDALRRVRATASLGTRSAPERAAELEGAIVTRAGREQQIAGRRVLLVDDVLTTGATANACAVALLGGGAAVVDVLAAARVPDPRLG